MEVMSRREAGDKGLVRYYTGSPCNRGHFVERYTASGNCIKCAAESSGRYAKNLRQSHKKHFGYVKVAYFVPPAMIDEVEKMVKNMVMAYEITNPPGVKAPPPPSMGG